MTGYRIKKIYAADDGWMVWNKLTDAMVFQGTYDECIRFFDKRA